MKLAVTQQNLNKALSIVTRILPARPALAVLNNVLLKTEAARLVVTATNLELAVVCKIGAKIEAEGAVTVPGRLLAELIGSLGNDKVQLISSENNLRLKAINLDSLLNGITADDFPVIPTIKPQTALKLPAAHLQRALSEVVVAAAVDEARPVLNGVYFNLSQDNLTLAATDSYRLAETKLAQSSAKPFAVIVPVRTAQELGRLLSNETGEVSIEAAANEAVFTLGEIQLISRLIEGKYPDYTQIFPKEFTTRAVINREELIKTVRIAALFARESANTIKLDLAKDKFELLSNASQVGENAVRVEAKITGKPITIQLNARYLLDALTAITTEAVQIELTGELNPCIIRPANGGGGKTTTKATANKSKAEAQSATTHIIMPLRT